MMKIHLCRCRFCNCLGHSVVVSITVLYSPLPPRYLRCRPRQRHQLPPHPLSFSLSLTCTRASARLQSQSDLAHKASCVLLRPRDREVFEAASTHPPTAPFGVARHQTAVAPRRFRPLLAPQQAAAVSFWSVFEILWIVSLMSSVFNSHCCVLECIFSKNVL